jgi:hypothetical protein
MRTADIEKREYSAFMKKATEFYHGMKIAAESGEWNQAMLSGIHCAISSIDAVTTWYLGLKSNSQNHLDVVGLLLRTSAPQASERVRQLQEILSLKTRVEYGTEELTPSKASTAVKQVERLFFWAKTVLPPQ